MVRSEGDTGQAWAACSDLTDAVAYMQSSEAMNAVSCYAQKRQMQWLIMTTEEAAAGRFTPGKMPRALPPPSWAACSPGGKAPAALSSCDSAHFELTYAIKM